MFYTISAIFQPYSSEDHAEYIFRVFLQPIYAMLFLFHKWKNTASLTEFSMDQHILNNVGNANQTGTCSVFINYNHTL